MNAAPASDLTTLVRLLEEVPTNIRQVVMAVSDFALLRKHRVDLLQVCTDATMLKQGVMCEFTPKGSTVPTQIVVQKGLQPGHWHLVPRNTTPAKDLCPGIRRTVAWLQGHGFETTDSGDGHSNEGMECALPVPNVTMVCQPWMMTSEADRLLMLLAGHGVVLEPCSPEEPGPPQIQASYDPANGVAAIVMLNVDDKLLFPEG